MTMQANTNRKAFPHFWIGLACALVLILSAGFSYAQGDDPDYQIPYPDNNGVSYEHSLVSMADIRDGTTNTYMFGERYLCPDNYLTGTDASDDWCMYRGSGNDLVRSTHLGWTPLQDKSGYVNSMRFGSAHSGGCNMVFCDGSVRSISYSIDPTTHRRLGNRRDGQPVDGARF